MMIVTFLAVMYGWHKIAHIIVREYGLLGAAITCGIIYVVTLIVERCD
jgi:hypothetical protein